MSECVRNVKLFIGIKRRMKTKIYILLDPCGEIRYAGKTIQTLGNRLSRHIDRARSGRTGHKNNWIRSLLNKQTLPTIQLVGEVEGNGSKEEIAWIAYFRAEGIRLTNTTDGGEGMLNPSLEIRRKIGEARRGHIVSVETRKKLSKASKGNVSPMKGKKHSTKSRRKMSEAGKRKKFSAEHRHNISKALKGMKHSAESKLKMSKALKGKKRSVEHQQKINASLKGRTAWNKGKHHTTETRRKISNTKRGKKLSIETRRKMSEAHKARRHLKKS